MMQAQSADTKNPSLAIIVGYVIAISSVLAAILVMLGMLVLAVLRFLGLG